MSEAIIKSLSIINDFEVKYPGQFARLYFPKSHAGWKRSGKCGKNENGSQKGQGLYLWAGGWLAKMQKRNLIFNLGESGYCLSPKGEKLLIDLSGDSNRPVRK